VLQSPRFGSFLALPSSASCTLQKLMVSQVPVYFTVADVGSDSALKK